VCCDAKATSPTHQDASPSHLTPHGTVIIIDHRQPLASTVASFSFSGPMAAAGRAAASCSDRRAADVSDERAGKTLGVSCIINRRKLENSRKRPSFFGWGGPILGVRTLTCGSPAAAAAAAAAAACHTSHTGAVDGHSTLRRATGASVSYFDAPEPIPAPRSVRAARGTYILRVVHVSALTAQRHSWWTPGPPRAAECGSDIAPPQAA